MSKIPKSLTLSERIEARAKALHSDKRPPVIRQIIGVHKMLATLHQENSWAHLVEILKAEDVHLSEGTLRNYVARIGKAKAALEDEGVLSPTDEQVHAAVWRTSVKKPDIPKASILSHSTALGKPPSSVSAISTGVTPRSSLSRNANRDL